MEENLIAEKDKNKANDVAWEGFIMNLPLISVIITMYNVQKYARQCIDSVIHQTYQNLEIILVDDGSPDSVGEICDEYAKIDDRVRVFHKKNGGISSARNYGIDVAKGEWITFVDGDDWVEPDMYESLYKTATENNVKVSACLFYEDYKDGSREQICTSKTSIFEGREEIFRAVVVDSALRGFAWNKLFRKDFLMEGYRFEEGKNYEDVRFTKYVILNAPSVALVKKHLYHYRQRKNSIAHTDNLKNAIDNWEARAERRILFSDLPEDCQRAMRIDCFMVCNQTWRACLFSKDREKYQKEIKSMSDFAKEYYPEIRKGNYSLTIRIIASLTRVNNQFSYLVVWMLGKLQRMFDLRGKRRVKVMY